MDEESASSIKSEESIPNPIYEEVILSENIRNIKDDSFSLLNTQSNNDSLSITPQSDETSSRLAEMEFYDDNEVSNDGDADDDDDDDGSSRASNSTDNSSVATSCSSICSIDNLKKYIDKKTSESVKNNHKDDDNEDNVTDGKSSLSTHSLLKNNIDNVQTVASDSLLSITTTTTATTTIPLTATSETTNSGSTKILTSSKSSKDSATKSTNIKLLIKKPQGYEIKTSIVSAGVSGENDESSPIIKLKPPAKPVFFVTVVSNTPTGPTYSTATYSPAGESQAQFLQQVTNKTGNVPVQEVLNNLKMGNLSDDTPIKIQDTESSTKITTTTTTVTSITSTKESDMDTGIIDSNLETAESKLGKTIEKLDKEKTMVLNKTYGKVSSAQEDLDDIDSVKSDQDQEIKTSTPKMARELLQLQKTVSESKVLSEYINESTSMKGRKSRKLVSLKHGGSDVEYSPYSLGSNTRRSRSRSRSKPRIDSPLGDSGGSPSFFNELTSSSSEKTIKRMNMRSQNSEFMQKHMKFLNRINNADNADTDNSDGEIQSSETKSIPPVESHLDILKKNYSPPSKRGWDAFCWKCTMCGDLIPCSSCVRSYHIKCLKNQSLAKIDKDWICPECCGLEHFMKGTSSRSGKNSLSVDHLNQLMHFALKRMKQVKGHENFFDNLDEDEYQDYYKYIVNPVTLETMQKKIENRVYKCSEELIMEAKWIQHNATICFGSNNKITSLAKQIVKVCRQEANEIETCPECYYNANTKKDWFIEVCSKPHILLWAKLKGFPYWPAKSMGINSSLVNVRFFGAHDRAHVPLKDCFLYSAKDPNPTTKQSKRNLIAGSIKEVDLHIQKIITKFGTFKFAPFKTLYDPSKELYQLEMMIPGITQYMKDIQESSKPALTFKIVKTADNNLSMIKKTDSINGDIRGNNEFNTATTTSNDGNKKITHSNINCSGSIIKISKKLNTSLLSSSSSSSSSVLTKTINTSNPKTSVILKKTSNEPFLSSENDQNVLISSSSPTASSAPSAKIASSSVIKSYEVISRNDESENNKVNSVILKRKAGGKSDKTGWSPIMVACKKFKMNTEDKEISSAEESKQQIENDFSKKNEKEKDVKKTLDSQVEIEIADRIEKRKLSIDNNENLSNQNESQKRKLHNEKSDQQKPGTVSSSASSEITLTTTKPSQSPLITMKNSNNKSPNSNYANSEEILTIRIGNSKIISKSVLSAMNEDHNKTTSSQLETNKTKENHDGNENQKQKKNYEKESDKISIKIENEDKNTIKETHHNTKINSSSASKESQSNKKQNDTITENNDQDSGTINETLLNKEHVKNKQDKPQEINFFIQNANLDCEISKKIQSEKNKELFRKSQNNEMGEQTQEISSNSANKTVSSESHELAVTTVTNSVQQQTKTLFKNKSSKNNETNSNAKSSDKILVNVQHVSRPASSKTCNLIPFTEIKTEKPDNDDEQQSNDNISCSASSLGFTDTQTKLINDNQSSSSSNCNVIVPGNTSVNSSTATVTIKREICSDDDDVDAVIADDNVAADPSSKSTASESITSNDKLNTNLNENNRDKSPNSQRITVKDFATMRVQPVVKKLEKKLITSQSGVSKVDMKKRSQRAKKSFPNKGNMPSPILSLSSGTVTSKPPLPTQLPFSSCSKQNLNSMVYIPLDSKVTTPLQKSVPIPPVTAASKLSVTNHNQQQQQQSNIAETTTTLSTVISGNSALTTTVNTNNITITKSSISNVSTSTSAILSIPSPALPVSSNHQSSNQPSKNNHNSKDSEPSSSSSSLPVGEYEQRQHMLSGFVTPNLASAITETIVRGPPKLAPKPSGPLRSDGDFIFPTEAGPVCKTLMENAHKMTDFFRSVIEDTLSDMANNGVLEAKIRLLELEIEKMKHSHNKEIVELKHNTDLMLCEMRNSLENEKQRLISETRKQCELERIRAVEEAKKKQWCANCGKEAQFYCCWNTSYCDYPCQQKHWSRHMNSCAQNDNPDASAQKVGVKIQPFSVKDKSLISKTKDIPIPRLPPNTFLRPASITAQAQRNSVPVHRLVSIPVPISTTTPPRFTLLNREGNWELMSTTSPQSNFQHLVNSNVLSSGSGTNLKTGNISSNSTRIADTVIRSNKL